MSEGIELRFWAAVHSIESGDEERLATFYVLNTSLNLNNWRVTDKALEDALPGLMGKSLNCIPGYRVNHAHKPLQVGRWVRVEKPDGYALATAEITDDVAWERLNGGEWGPVSVVIRAFKVTCSVCGGDITSAPDEHVVGGEGHEVIEGFRFERVDFVSRPAYPQSDLLNLGHMASGGAPGVLLVASVVPFEETVKAPEGRTWDVDEAEARVRSWAGGPDKEEVDWSRYRRAFAWYDREDQEVFGSYKLQHHDVVDGMLSVVWSGVSAAMQVLLGARGGVDVPEGDRRGIYSHLARHYRQFDREVPEYHTSRSNVDGPQGAQGGDPDPEGKREKKGMEEKLAELEQELEAVKGEKQELESRLQAIEDERHAERVATAVDARVKAGLVKEAERQAETDRLTTLDDGALALLGEDAVKVAESMAKAQPAGPKAKYTAEDRDTFEAAVEDARERLFGHRRAE